MRNRLLIWMVTAGMNLGVWAGETLLFEADFNSAPVGRAPEGMLVLDGGFAVVREGDRQWLELPGAPLETYGVLAGPTEKENVVVQARIRGTSQGRRHPTFAVGLGGSGGYRLEVSPGRRTIELRKGDLELASGPFEWRSGTWTLLRLQVVKAGERTWRVQGKAWTEGTAEPAAWGLSVEESAGPRPGRAALWGCPFSGNPIQYDDLRVLRVVPAGT
ncbi:MAG TPA: hypothetical protein PKM73_13810 [Verrucomicrobiota bacterium]|nr:hypothetical protein [Verrucomicrobiota bacterium]HNU51904.1 hypothetical protein [Verrucomicrobiota bacterium]